MRKVFSTKYSDTAFSVAMLALRFGMGVLMIPHGFDKMKNFARYSKDFTDPFHVGSTVSLSLNIFAEFFCASFIVLGLMTRLACIPLIIAMCVALFIAHNGQIFGDGEHAALFLTGYLTLLFTGPGNISMDKLIGK